MVELVVAVLMVQAVCKTGEVLERKVETKRAADYLAELGALEGTQEYTIVDQMVFTQAELGEIENSPLRDLLRKAEKRGDSLRKTAMP